MKVAWREAETPRHATIELGPLETTALRAAMGEVCYGFDVPEFETRMGSTYDEAQQLFHKLDRLSDDRQNEIVLTDKEVSLLKKAHEETIRQLGPEEYETRTAVDFAFAQALLKQLAETHVSNR